MSTKSICRVLPVPKSAAAVLRYCYRQRKGDTTRDKAGVLAVAGHAEGGVLVRDARLDSEVLKSRCPLGKNPVKHVIISPEKNDPDVVKRLMRAGQHWCQRFAPGRSFVLIVHMPDKDSPHIHLHIIVENYNNEKAIHGDGADANDMWRMKFTDAFVAVREDGSPSPHRGANKVYPHAKDLKAQKVADLLRAGQTWESLKASKVIKDAPPRRGREDVTSFIYQGKQIRFVTVEKLLGSKAKVEAKVVAPVPVVPVAPVQQPVAKTKPKVKSKEDLAREAAYAAVDITRRGLGGLVEKAEEVTDEKAIDDLYKGKEPDEPKERGGRGY